MLDTALAFEVMLTGRPIEAREAVSCGLVSRLVPDAEIGRAALDRAQAVLANSPFSIRQTKQLMWTNLESPDLDAALELEKRAQILAKNVQ